MRKDVLFVSVAVAVAVGVASCQKLEEPSLSADGPRTVTLKAVNPELGELIAVTSAPDWPTAAQLWFVKPDKTISMVAVDMKANKLSSTTILIPRQ